MFCFEPKSHEDLFPCFERLEAGESVLLGKVDPKERYSEPEERAVGFFSSGSTGRPKLVWRRWDRLLADVRGNGDRTGWIWASPFGPCSYAGLQVAVHAWRSGGRVVSLRADWQRTWADLAGRQVTALSCTPTFLDLLIQYEDGKQFWSPLQITLGGEVLRHRAGVRFRERFPETRFTVIYASAEHGILLKTGRLDGWYETESLARRGASWRLKGGVLELLTQGEWRSTGDQLEFRGDLVRVLGRADAVANVGGVKVNLDEIARLAEEVPGVRRAVAVADLNPVVGEVVSLKYALDPAACSTRVQECLEAYLRGRLRKEAWPRRWQLDTVGLGSNSKRARE